MVPQPVTTPSPGIFVFLRAEIGAAVADGHVVFFKTALIQQDFQPLPGGEYTFGVLGSDTPLAAAQMGIVVSFTLLKLSWPKNIDARSSLQCCGRLK